MEKREEVNLKDPSLKLAREVAALKDALEANKLKELIIANIMQVQDKEKLTQIVSAIRKITHPINKGPDITVPESAQGNK